MSTYFTRPTKRSVIMDTINLNFNPDTDIAHWSGGIDSTLAISLLIEKYGANNIVVMHWMRVPEENAIAQLSLPFYEQAIDIIGMNRDSFDGNYKTHFVESDAVLQHKRVFEATGRYNVVAFTTERGRFETPIHTSHFASTAFGYLGYDIMSKFEFKQPLLESHTDRGNVLEMYKAKKIEDLLLHTRSCGIKYTTPRIADTQRSILGDVSISEEQFLKNVHCGVCPKCLKRKYGFKSIGMDDPTIYIR